MANAAATKVDISDWESLLDTIPETPERILIPPATYTVRVEKAEAGLSKNGNPKIELTLVVEDGQYKGQRVWGRINFATGSPNSMAVTIAQLGEFGITRKWLATNNPTTDQIARKLLGELISVKVSHREWEGTTYYDVKGYTAVPSSGGSYF